MLTISREVSGVCMTLELHICFMEFRALLSSESEGVGLV